MIYILLAKYPVVNRNLNDINFDVFPNGRAKGYDPFPEYRVDSFITSIGFDMIYKSIHDIPVSQLPIGYILYTNVVNLIVVKQHRYSVHSNETTPVFIEFKGSR